MVKNRINANQPNVTLIASVFESCIEAMLILDATKTDYPIVYTNSAFEALMGYGHREVIGKQFHLLYENTQVETTPLERILKGQKGGRLNLRLRTKNARLLWVELSLSPLVQDEVLTHYSVMLRDITEQVYTRTLHQKIDLINSVLDAVIITDKDFNVLIWSRAAEQLYGWTAQEVLGVPIDNLIKTQYNDKWTTEDSIHTLFSQGYWRGDVKQRNRDGQLLDIRSSVTITRDTADNTEYVIAINRDLSAYRKLERQVAEAELKQIEIEAQRELVELKEQFTSMVSHELRNPLATIMTSTDLIKNYGERMTEERQMHHLDKILGQCRHMQTLMNDILVYSKAEANQINLQPKPVLVDEFCHALVEQLASNDQFTHTIEFYNEAQHSTVTLDPRLLEHILENVLTNAMKYSPPESKIQFRTYSPDNTTIAFTIEDKGIGIPPEAQEHLFDPFYRANNVGQIYGTGLGLAIVKRHVEAMRGQISVNSRVGQGTIFTIQLPESLL